MKLYQYPKCSTCRKATKFLQEQGQDFVSIDITQQPPNKTELRKMLKSYDGDIRKLFNTSGVQYRELGMKDRIADMSAAEAVELLSGNGKLIKRPFLLQADGRGIVGFNVDAWSELIA